MMASENIIDVTESNFQYEVLAYSNNTPVIVDFWADWCQPCHMLSPILEKLTREANGAFRLAKVNADQNRNLVMQYDIRSLPTVKFIVKGQVAAEFVGAQPETKVRDILRKLAPPTQNLSIEKGQSLLGLQRWAEADLAFRETLKTEPDDSAALLGLAKSLLAQGKASNALAVLQEFPASKEFQSAEKLIPLALRMAEFQDDEIALLEDDDLDPTYRLAIQLVGRGNLAAAADGLLDILRQNKTYRNGEARQAVLAVLEIMGEDKDETRKYRNELAALLF